MLVPVAFATVVIVWSTTPLMVQWSSTGTEFLWAAFLRMSTAAVFGWLLLKALRLSFPVGGKAMHSYGYGVIGVFGAMVLVYASAGDIPSGLISLLFGLSPVITGLIARYVYAEPGFTRIQWVGLATCVAGLAIVTTEGADTGKASIEGIVLVLASVTLFCLSGILVKRADAGLHPLQQTVGTLACAVPLYGATVWAFGSEFTYTQSSALAIVYLALLGSIAAFLAYFFILQRLPAATVALATVISPVFALFIGASLNGERMTDAGFVGTAVLIAGLMIYLLISKKEGDTV